MRTYIFYNYDGTLHDIIEDDIEIKDAIDPGSNKKYNMDEFDSHFCEKDICEILKERETLIYLASEHAEELIQDLKYL